MRCVSHTEHRVAMILKYFQLRNGMVIFINPRENLSLSLLPPFNIRRKQNVARNFLSEIHVRVRNNALFVISCI